MATASKEWFSVDRKGLKDLMGNKPKDFVVYELLQNAWDENVTSVSMKLERVPGTPNVRLIVSDDSPDGFADLRDAHTLFGSASGKRAAAEKRGRWSLGDKLVLSLASEATIISTKGGVRFDESGRHVLRRRRVRGSEIEVVLRMTSAEMADCAAAALRLIPPAGVETRFNGELLAQRTPVATLEATLATEIADAEGTMTRTRRKTRLDIYEPVDGAEGSIYELGIPVVGNGCRWDVDIAQKVPLNLNRDNVTPAYLAEVRSLVLKAMTERLSTEDANAPWVREAVTQHGDALPDETIRRLTTLRFGDKCVIFDPSDREANSRAAFEGYTLVHGSQLGAREWEAVRRARAILPAGQVTPSPKPYSEDGVPLKALERTKWTPRMCAVVAYFERIAPRLIGRTPAPSKIVSDPTWPFAATYGPQSGLTLNLGRLGHRWFDGPLANITDLLVHELGHEDSENHLSSEYHDALTRYAGKLVALALAEPEIFDLDAAEVAC